MRVGITFSSFDLLHAGHVMMLKEAKKQCDHLIVGLQLQDNNYFSLSTGFFTGQEWRKPMADRLYFVHGPEIGTYYSSSVNYSNIAPSLRYQFGALFQINTRFNIVLTAPMSLTTSFGKSDGQWNQSAFNIGLFNENNLLTLTYVFKNQTTE